MLGEGHFRFWCEAVGWRRAPHMLHSSNSLPQPPTPPEGSKGQSTHLPTPPEGSKGQSTHPSTPPEGSKGQSTHLSTPREGGELEAMKNPHSASQARRPGPTRRRP